MSNYAYRIADEIIDELRTRYGFSEWWYKVPPKIRAKIINRMVDKIEYYGAIKYICRKCDEDDR